MDFLKVRSICENYWAKAQTLLFRLGLALEPYSRSKSVKDFHEGLILEGLIHEMAQIHIPCSTIF